MTKQEVKMIVADAMDCIFKLELQAGRECKTEISKELEKAFDYIYSIRDRLGE